MGIWSIGNLKLASHTDNRELESTFDDDSFELRQIEEPRAATAAQPGAAAHRRS